MKIAVSLNENNIKSNLSDLFGRCPYFAIVEINDDKVGETKFIKNEFTDKNSGAGVSVAQLIAENNVEVVITGSVGPRALDILKQFKIKVYAGNGELKNVLQSFIKNKLEIIN